MHKYKTTKYYQMHHLKQRSESLPNYTSSQRMKKISKASSIFRQCDIALTSEIPFTIGSFKDHMVITCRKINFTFDHWYPCNICLHWYRLSYNTFLSNSSASNSLFACIRQISRFPCLQALTHVCLLMDAEVDIDLHENLMKRLQPFIPFIQKCCLTCLCFASWTQQSVYPKYN